MHDVTLTLTPYQLDMLQVRAIGNEPVADVILRLCDANIDAELGIAPPITEELYDLAEIKCRNGDEPQGPECFGGSDY